MCLSDPGDTFQFCVCNTDTNVFHPLLYYYYYYLNLIGKAGKKIFLFVCLVGLVFLRFEKEM